MGAGVGTQPVTLCRERDNMRLQYVQRSMFEPCRGCASQCSIMPSTVVIPLNRLAAVYVGCMAGAVQVVVPATYSELTSRRVLTQQWLEGEKLSQSKAADVGSLVNVGVICYLKQLLDTGFFHADPHPGNLIRTPDGRLAVLDYGLMTEIDDEIKYGMIEAISHLIHRDYEAIVQDFVTLQFIPQGTDLTPILPVLAKVGTAASTAASNQ